MSTENTESLSYKFQRLRERLREAIVNGELSGKLPGERALAAQFRVNAKTLSKALTDLAAEGILDRSIGRGTYVKGQAPTPVTVSRWLVLADPQTPAELIESFRQHGESIQVLTDPIEKIRPSFLNQFTGVIDLASDTPESFLRDLVVRNICVVVVGRESRGYSMNAVMVDLQLGAARVARSLVLSGHRQIAMVSDSAQGDLVLAARSAASRIDESTVIDSVRVRDVPLAVRSGVTAVLCASPAIAKDVAAALKTANLSSEVMAIGLGGDDVNCSGYYVNPAQIASAVTELLTNPQPCRPATLWLAGDYKQRSAAALPLRSQFA